MLPNYCPEVVELLWKENYVGADVADIVCCILESPLMISVVDARLITFTGPTLVPVKKLASLKANTACAGKANLCAAMTCKLISISNCNVMQCNISGNAPNLKKLNHR